MEAKEPRLTFTVETAGSDALDLRAICERYVNELWLPDHMLPDELTASALDQFKRAVAAEMAQLDVTTT